jgi:hypothetical protein
MSDLNIFELTPAGSELFDDSENYIQDLTEEEMDVAGAKSWGITGINVNASINGDISIFNNSIFTAVANSIVGNSVGNAVSVVRR